MAQFVNLNPGSLRELHVGNERLVSYNVEMTEVTGGTFWKAYTPAQIAGTEPFVLKGGFLGNATASTDLMQYYDPIDLSDKKLRKLAKEIGPAWVRVSGTWSTKTYYDFDGHTNGVIPELQRHPDPRAVARCAGFLQGHRRKAPDLGGGL
mgnify:FL=1